jgi:Predicted integral membrane protein
MFTRTLIVSAVFFLIAVAAAAWLYSQMPARVPVQWDRLSHVSRTVPRFWGAASPALMILVLGVFTHLLPLILPRLFNSALFAQVYGIVMLTSQGAMLVAGLSVLLVDAGYPLPVPTVTMLTVGALLMVLGSYMGKLRKHFFIGIRTPWTLASEVVWERTHRLGGWLFVLAGLVMVIGALIGAPAWLVPAAIVPAALIPCVYSFWIHRQLDKVA